MLRRIKPVLIKPRYALILSRFVGYLSVVTASFILPIIVYKLTGSAKIAGVVMIFEWGPKGLAYIFGGKLIASIGTLPAYRLIDVFRLAGFSFFALALHFKDYRLLLIGAPLCQFSNAFSNIILDKMTVALWPNKSRKGFIYTAMADSSAWVVGLPLLAFLSPAYAITFGIIVCIANFILNRHDKCQFIEKEHVFKSVNTLELFSNIKTAFKYKPLRDLIVFSFATSLPLAVFLSQVPLFLALYNSAVAESSSINSIIRMTTSLLLFTVLYFLKRIKEIDSKMKYIIALDLIAMPLMAFAHSFNQFFTIFCVAFSLSSYFMVFNRENRLKLLIEIDLAHINGVIIGIESIVFIVSALLIYLFHAHVSYIYLVIPIFLAWSSYNLFGIPGQKIAQKSLTTD